MTDEDSRHRVNDAAGETLNFRNEETRALVPTATRIAVLVNQADPVTENQLREVQAAALTMGLKIQVRNANTSREIYAVFETMGPERPDVLFVAATPFLNGRSVQLAQLAAFHRSPLHLRCEKAAKRAA